MAYKSTPIQTSYMGYKFRSRLEARWAVFFKALKTDFEYEKEGYDIDGTWYLPDFWIPYGCATPPEWGHWVEIKANPLTEKESSLLAGLTRITGHRSYAVCGNPWDGQHEISVFQHHHMGEPKEIPLISGGSLVEINDHKGTEFESVGSVHISVRSKGYRDFGFPVQSWSMSPGDMHRAFLAARSARFEHGEKPLV